MKIAIGFAALTLLAGCGQGSEPGGVTAEESQQLNEAAAMLDAAPDNVAAGDETGLGGQPAGTRDLPVTDNTATDTQ